MWLDRQPPDPYDSPMTPGFEAAQARYDSMLPPDPVVYTCKYSGESSEDCMECIEYMHDGEPDDDLDEEPPDFDDYKNGMGQYADDYYDD